MGYHLFDIRLLHAGTGQQAVLHLQLQAAHDLAVVFFHQVVDLGDGPGGGVLDGQDAVPAHTGLHRPEHTVKAPKIHDLGQGKHLGAGHLRVGPLGSLAGHHRPAGELPGGFRRRRDLPAQGGLPGVQPVLLIIPAQLQQGGEEDLGVLLQLLPARPGDPVEDVPLPARVQDRGVVLLLVVRHVPDGLHALCKQRHDLIVDLVQLVPVILQVHDSCPPNVSLSFL